MGNSLNLPENLGFEFEDENETLGEYASQEQEKTVQLTKNFSLTSPYFSENSDSENADVDALDITNRNKNITHIKNSKCLHKEENKTSKSFACQPSDLESVTRHKENIQTKNELPESPYFISESTNNSNIVKECTTSESAEESIFQLEDSAKERFKNEKSCLPSNSKITEDEIGTVQYTNEENSPFSSVNVIKYKPECSHPKHSQLFSDNDSRESVDNVDDYKNNSSTDESQNRAEEKKRLSTTINKENYKKIVCAIQSKDEHFESKINKDSKKAKDVYKNFEKENVEKYKTSSSEEDEAVDKEKEAGGKENEAVDKEVEPDCFKYIQVPESQYCSENEKEIDEDVANKICHNKDDLTEVQYFSGIKNNDRSINISKLKLKLKELNEIVYYELDKNSQMHVTHTEQELNKNPEKDENIIYSQYFEKPQSIENLERTACYELDNDITLKNKTKFTSGVEKFEDFEKNFHTGHSETQNVDYNEKVEEDLSDIVTESVICRGENNSNIVPSTSADARKLPLQQLDDLIDKYCNKEDLTNECNFQSTKTEEQNSDESEKVESETDIICSQYFDDSKNLNNEHSSNVSNTNDFEFEKNMAKIIGEDAKSDENIICSQYFLDQYDHSKNANSENINRARGNNFELGENISETVSMEVNNEEDADCSQYFQDESSKNMNMKNIRRADSSDNFELNKIIPETVNEAVDNEEDSLICSQYFLGEPSTNVGNLSRADSNTSFDLDKNVFEISTKEVGNDNNLVCSQYFLDQPLKNMNIGNITRSNSNDNLELEKNVSEISSKEVDNEEDTICSQYFQDESSENINAENITNITHYTKHNRRENELSRNKDKENCGKRKTKDAEEQSQEHADYYLSEDLSPHLISNHQSISNQQDEIKFSRKLNEYKDVSLPLVPPEYCNSINDNRQDFQKKVDASKINKEKDDYSTNINNDVDKVITETEEGKGNNRDRLLNEKKNYGKGYSQTLSKKDDKNLESGSNKPLYSCVISVEFAESGVEEPIIYSQYFRESPKSDNTEKKTPKDNAYKITEVCNSKGKNTDYEHVQNNSENDGTYIHFKNTNTENIKYSADNGKREKGCVISLPNKDVTVNYYKHQSDNLYSEGNTDNLVSQGNPSIELTQLIAGNVTDHDKNTKDDTSCHSDKCDNTSNNITDNEDGKDVICSQYFCDTENEVQFSITPIKQLNSSSCSNKIVDSSTLQLDLQILNNLEESINVKECKYVHKPKRKLAKTEANKEKVISKVDCTWENAGQKSKLTPRIKRRRKIEVSNRKQDKKLRKICDTHDNKGKVDR